MAISPRTRKVLWSLSGNACARCDTPLVRAPEAAGEVHAIIGRECHIVARVLSGPRGDAGSRDEIDGYENLILLCANCHAVIDGQLERFPPEELQRLKHEHEQRVTQRATPPPPDVRLHGRHRPVRLELVRSGDALLDVIAPSLSIAYERPDGLSPSQRELLGNFLQSCQDWGDIYNDIGPKGHLDAGQHIDDDLNALGDEGLVVYTALRRLTLTGGEGDHETPWPEAVIKVVHEHDARVDTAPPAAAGR